MAPGIITNKIVIKDVDTITITGKEHIVSKIINLIEQHKKLIKWDDSYGYFDAMIGKSHAAPGHIIYPKIIQKIYSADNNNSVTILCKDYVLNKIDSIINAHLKVQDLNDNEYFNNVFNNSSQSSMPLTSSTTLTPLTSSTKIKTFIKSVKTTELDELNEDNYSGAGTTIFLKDRAKKKYYLVVIEENKNNVWESFGGKRENNSCEETAKKETREESRNVFIIHNLSDTRYIDIKAPSNKLYRNYIIVIDYIDFTKINQMFIDNMSKLLGVDRDEPKIDKKYLEGYYETSKIDFVDYDNLKKMIKDKYNKCHTLNEKIKLGDRTCKVLTKIIETVKIDEIVISNNKYKEPSGDDDKKIIVINS